jgi:hypothetical protein
MWPVQELNPKPGCWQHSVIKGTRIESYGIANVTLLTSQELVSGPNSRRVKPETLWEASWMSKRLAKHHFSMKSNGSNTRPCTPFQSREMIKDVKVSKSLLFTHCTIPVSIVQYVNQAILYVDVVKTLIGKKNTKKT